MLEGLAHDGRKYEIVSVVMTGSHVKATVDISDDGHIWAQETIEADVEDGQLQTFDVTSIELQFWRI